MQFLKIIILGKMFYKVHMNNGPFRYFTIKHFYKTLNPKFNEKLICNSQGLMIIRSNFNHFKFHEKIFAKVFKKMVLYICYLFSTYTKSLKIIKLKFIMKTLMLYHCS